MEHRTLGKTGFRISAISLGTWQLGGKWGAPFSPQIARQTIHQAVDAGINFFDTADVYREGLSEQSIGRELPTRSEQVYVATKCGRQINPHTNENYTPQALRKYVEGSLQNMGVETLDLIQLHCPPPEVYQRPEIFGLFEDLKREGKIQHMGVSVEKIAEAEQALQFDNVATLQIIFNIFRPRPAESLFQQAAAKKVGIIVRVPLASGLLTGKYALDTSFDQKDHRNFNREGAFFDKGETFSGVPYETGLQAVAEIKELFPHQPSLAPIALRWVLDHPQVSTVIPGASRPQQIADNLQALNMQALSAEQHRQLSEVYASLIKPLVHHLW